MKSLTDFPNKGEYLKYLRIHFAGMAMQGYLSNSAESDVSVSFVLEKLGLPKETPYSFEEHYPKYVAKISTIYADALLKQLESNE